LKAVLGLEKLPWKDGQGIDVLLVDPKNRRIRPLDLTGNPSEAHRASKQLQADALQRRLDAVAVARAEPKWTVERAEDFHHNKGFSEAKVIAQIGIFLESYGWKR
jgi:hypothetical protein